MVQYLLIMGALRNKKVNTMIRFIILSLCIGGPMLVSAQSFPHDQCASAVELIPGQRLPVQNNEFAGITEGETPAVQPATCIKTFENDLWYSFTTDSTNRFYKIQIDPIICETPAGLQALIIRSDDCTAESYTYVACENPYAVEQLVLWVEDSVPGHRYLVEVDGYDGNICTYTLDFLAYPRDPREVDDFLRQTIDYAMPPVEFEPDDASAFCLNNQISLTWSEGSQQDLELYLVQGVRGKGNFRFGRRLARFEPRQAVGMDEGAVYRFTDSRILEAGQEYCYRIVRISASGERTYSEEYCTIAQINEDFFISPVFESEEKRKFYIQFRNHKKQDLTFQVLDQDQVLLKEMTRSKEPKGPGTISIDMTDYDPGRYFLKVIGKSEFYLRRFVVE